MFIASAPQPWRGLGNIAESPQAQDSEQLTELGVRPMMGSGFSPDSALHIDVEI